MTFDLFGNRFAGKLSNNDFYFGTMDENNKPGSWLSDLSELIKKKKEENELLQKVRHSLEFPKPDHDTRSDAGLGNADDNVNGDK